MEGNYNLGCIKFSGTWNIYVPTKIWRYVIAKASKGYPTKIWKYIIAKGVRGLAQWSWSFFAHLDVPHGELLMTQGDIFCCFFNVFPYFYKNSIVQTKLQQMCWINNVNIFQMYFYLLSKCFATFIMHFTLKYVYFKSPFVDTCICHFW